jgi:hypothetical protein
MIDCTGLLSYSVKWHGAVVTAARLKRSAFSHDGPEFAQRTISTPHCFHAKTNRAQFFLVLFPALLVYKEGNYK